MDQSIHKKYNYWQWRTLIILMIGYALFYFVRKNFSIVMPALESELGISKLQLGMFLTLNGIIYGVSRFINGFLVDRIRAKRVMMACGLFLSALNGTDRAQPADERPVPLFGREGRRRWDWSISSAACG